MNNKFSGLYKIAGISLLLAVLWALMAYYTPESFLKANNIENLMRRTALYGVLGIGVAFVIITAGIDLSIGSVVCFSGCLLAILLQVEYVPVDQVQVQSVSTNGEVMVSAVHPFSKSDRVRFDQGKRARDLIATIESIAVQADGRCLLKLDRPFTRDDDTGYLTKMFRIHPDSEAKQPDSQPKQPDSQPKQPDSQPKAVERDSVQLAGSGLDQRVNSGDEIWLFNAASGLQKRKLNSISGEAENGFLITMDEMAVVEPSSDALLLTRTTLASVPVALLTVLMAGLLLGLIHGLLITKLNMQPFVVTLCSLLIFRSISRWMASDQMVGFGNEYDVLKQFGVGKWMVIGEGGWTFGIPYPFFVLVVVAIAAMVLLNFTIWGRYMKALGRNEEATHYSGVNTDNNKILAYVICSGLAALGGIMFALDANSIAPYSFGNFFELYAIAAAVLGGCSLRGGEGGILGVIVGTALMQTLYNMIVLWKISSQLELAIVGIVILLGVMADELLKQITSRRRAA